MGTNRVLVLALMFVVVGTAGVSITTWLGEWPTADGALFPRIAMMPMMGGGMMHDPRMRAMMQEMMSGRLPPGITPERLPDPNSPGATLLIRYCTQCHNLPAPAMHTAEEWPAVEARMFNRMAMMSGMGGMGGMMRRRMMPIRAPAGEEQETILAYLQGHALRPANVEALGPPDTPGLALFRQTCSQCHALPDPTLHTADEWPVVVDRMRKNMRAMDRRVITDPERDEIVGFLATEAGS
ncbi:MAG: cytochrome c [Nitrospirae bacterium]|nr:cytochrome c [Nitrospirota bacterium]